MPQTYEIQSEPKQVPIEPIQHAANSLDDSKREIYLMDPELENYWPSIASKDEVLKHEPHKPVEEMFKFAGQMDPT